MTTYTCRQCAVWKVDEANQPLPEVIFQQPKDALTHAVEFHGSRVVEILLQIPGVVAGEQLLEFALRDCRADLKESTLPVISHG